MTSKVPQKYIFLTVFFYYYYFIIITILLFLNTFQVPQRMMRSVTCGTSAAILRDLLWDPIRDLLIYCRNDIGGYTLRNILLT